MPPDTFCGTGTLSGHGAGTKITDFVSFEPIEGTACADVEVVQESTVEAGTLVLVGEGTFCSPGASDAARFSDRGHPHVLDLTFVVDAEASTGAFAGASGSGSEHVPFAGDVAVATLAAMITLTS